MKQILLVTVCVCAVASGSAFAQSKYSASRPRSDAANAQGYRLMDNRSFLLSAAQGAFADVELARLALGRATSAEVKRYAQQMVDAGEKMSADLKPLLKTHDIPPQVAIDARHKVTRDWLMKLPDQSFDRAYMTAMSAKQQNDVIFLQRAAAITSDPDVKKWATEALPGVRESQGLARSISLGSR